MNLRKDHYHAIHIQHPTTVETTLPRGSTEARGSALKGTSHNTNTTHEHFKNLRRALPTEPSKISQTKYNFQQRISWLLRR